MADCCRFAEGGKEDRMAATRKITAPVPTIEGPFAAPGYPWIPLTFLFASLSMLTATVLRGAPEVVWALGLLTLGLPAYLVFRRIYSPATVLGPPAAV
jgi:hypothetical protein